MKNRSIARPLFRGRHCRYHSVIWTKANCARAVMDLLNQLAQRHASAPPDWIERQIRPHDNIRP